MTPVAWKPGEAVGVAELLLQPARVATMTVSAAPAATVRPSLGFTCLYSSSVG
jgi:hypothetical protein